MRDMHKSLLVASFAPTIALLELPSFAQPALLYSYTNPPRFEIRDIHGIVELWHMTEPCAPEVVNGTIESVEYTQGGGRYPKGLSTAYVCRTGSWSGRG